jgi:hypothetical protein
MDPLKIGPIVAAMQFLLPRGKAIHRRRQSSQTLGHGGKGQPRASRVLGLGMMVWVMADRPPGG